MNASEESSLELLRLLAPQVPIADREQYSQIYELFANPSGILRGPAQLHEHGQAVLNAQSNLLSLLRRLSSQHPNNEIIIELMKRYEAKGEFD